MTYPQYPLQKPVSGDPRTAPVRETGIVGQLADKANAIIDVKGDFGAVGDGVTDDTAAFAAAEAAVITAGGGAILRPAGDFLVGGNTIVGPSIVYEDSAGVDGSFLTVGAGRLILQAKPSPTVPSLYMGPPFDDLADQLIVKNDTIPFPNASTFELMHDGSGEYIFHLTGGPNMSGGALLGLGVTQAGAGMLVNNYKSGIGIRITNQATTDVSGAHALRVSNQSTVAPGAFFAQGAANVQPAAVFTANVAPQVSPQQVIVDFRTSSALGNSDIQLGKVVADPAAETFVWYRGLRATNDETTRLPMKVFGIAGTTANLQEWYLDSTLVAYLQPTGLFKAGSVQAEGASTAFFLYDTAGTVNARRWQIDQSTGVLRIRSTQDNLSSPVARLTISHSTGNLTPSDGAAIVAGTTTGLKIGSATTQKLGFWNATPVVQQVLATGAGATEDDIISLLQTLGLCKQS